MDKITNILLKMIWNFEIKQLYSDQNFIEISPKAAVDDKLSLLQVMTSHWIGIMTLPELMVTQLMFWNNIFKGIFVT